MANAAVTVMLMLIMAVVAATTEGAQSSSTQPNWAKKLKTRKKTRSETVTNLQFYFHDTVSGKNPSAVRVAQAPETEKSLTLFGALLMADDPLTETPDPKSKIVGRAQGMYGSSGQQEFGLTMAMCFAFCDGMYNGSSISIFGKNSALNPVREMPVVAGTGVFRLARGYAIAKTHWFNTMGDAIVGYNVTLIH
ncbi:dirigent protein 23 [Pyrus ussuriensis x Pyrus communis]|uniref:Dirigent protein n=1 Tax=Pyrus ussuriensis x Pyrus communis TaxID=2448454 RepID=A0A5N5IAA0_9ROSA|nr:dirigent protein 23 [Pyrus x bretschneideri]KAB2636187.1 dirigent protein 23 [Pyrus ussuriensis x Pyrus communis]